MAPSQIDKFIGLNVRAARLARGMSQTALGNRIGVTFQQVQKYERGVNRISAATLYAIAGVFDQSLDSFFAGARKPTAGRRTP